MREIRANDLELGDAFLYADSDHQYHLVARNKSRAVFLLTKCAHQQEVDYGGDYGDSACQHGYVMSWNVEPTIEFSVSAVMQQ